MPIAPSMLFASLNQELCQVVVFTIAFHEWTRVGFLRSTNYVDAPLNTD